MHITSAYKPRVIKRILIHIILLLITSNLVGQSNINWINISNKNDSIWMIEEYYPTQFAESNNQRQSYDFSTVNASCATLLTIRKEGNTLLANFGDTAKEEYVVEKAGYRSLSEPTLVSFFETYGTVSARNSTPEALVAFPLNEEQYEITQSWLFTVADMQGESLKKYDSLVCQVNIKKAIDVSDRKEFNFSFGSRLGISVTASDEIEFVNLVGYRAKKRIQLPLHYLDTKQIKATRKTLEVFNNYRGVLLAKAELSGERIVKVRIFEEVLGRGKYRPCNTKDEEFQLYPNPSYGKVNVLLNSTFLGDYQFILYNVIGKELYSQSIPHDEQVGKYNVQLPNPRKGTYLYSMIDPNGTRLFTRRLIIVDL